MCTLDKKHESYIAWLSRTQLVLSTYKPTMVSFMVPIHVPMFEKPSPLHPFTHIATRQIIAIFIVSKIIDPKFIKLIPLLFHNYVS